MSNDSTSAGYLTILSEPPAYDTALEALLIPWISAVSGLPQAQVRSRWATATGSDSDDTINCCEFAVTLIAADSSPAFLQQAEETRMSRHEILTCQFSFYGPASQQIAALFLYGIQVSQNNAELNQIGLSFLDASDLTASPELSNTLWVRRNDITVRLSRHITGEFGIKILAEGPVSITGE